jgi:hypothetical protein
MGYWKEGALKIDTFWMATSEKSEIFRAPTPSNGPSNGLAHIKLVKSKRLWFGSGYRFDLDQLGHILKILMFTLESWRLLPAGTPHNMSEKNILHFLEKKFFG